MRKTPRPHSKRPRLSFFCGKRPGPELASHRSGGGGAVFEAGKGVLYINNLVCWWVHVLRNNSAKRDSWTRTTQTCFYTFCLCKICVTQPLAY